MFITAHCDYESLPLDLLPLSLVVEVFVFDRGSIPIPAIVLIEVSTGGDNGAHSVTGGLCVIQQQL